MFLSNYLLFESRVRIILSWAVLTVVWFPHKHEIVNIRPENKTTGKVQELRGSVAKKPQAR